MTVPTSISPFSSRSTTRQAQAFLAPDTMHTFGIHHRQFAPDEGMDAAVPVAWMLSSEHAQAFCKLLILRPPMDTRTVPQT